MEFWKVTSDIIGWIYFVCWSISFYGQPYENYKVKHVKGLAFEYIALNITGFTFLSVYSTVGYFFPNAHGTEGVTIQDLIFAYHAVVLTIVQIFSIMYYYKKGDNEGVRPWCIIYLIFLWGLAIGYGLATYFDHNLLTKYGKEWNIWYVLGYEKLLITFVKYVPQAYLNYKRQSTEGWSIFNILMDFGGGLFSFLQIITESMAGEDDNAFGGGLNIVKFVLSLITMGFDCIFITQHYFLYAGSRKKKVALLDNQFYSGPTQISPINISDTNKK